MTVAQIAQPSLREPSNVCAETLKFGRVLELLEVVVGNEHLLHSKFTGHKKQPNEPSVVHGD